MKKHLISFALFFLSIIAFAQNTKRQFVSYRQNPLHLEVAVSDGTYRIVFYTADIVETTFLPKGESYNPESHAVVLAPNAITPNLKEAKGSIKYTTSGITVEVKKSPFQIVYHYKDKELLSEKSGYAQKTENKDGKSQLLETLNFNVAANEALYGGGARVLGLNRRGNRLQLYNRAHYGYETRAELMNFCIPMMMSSKIYAVHFDNAVIGYLDLDSRKDNTIAYETISGRKTYQVVAGDSWAKLIENYTALTGRQPLPPRWAFGNLASRFGYRNEEQAVKTIDYFRRDKIPVDAIIFDLYWFGKSIKGTMGNLEFDRDNFPNPEKMIADFNQKGVKSILITEPFILTSSKKWQEVVDKKILATDSNGKPFTYDFYFGNTGIVDIFKPEGRDWFWNIYKELHKKGVQGVWGDLGEPEVFPSEAITAKGKADEVHNIYGHNWAKLIFDGYKKDFPNERPFILMRSGYSGSQRFGMIPWSGDVNRTWGGLSGQTEIALGMGMQGLAYMHSDLGGFAGDYYDNELYLRWLQYGVFQPVFRPHAQEDVASEPVYKDVITKEKAKRIVELRYKMLPYNYTLAFENHKSGMPMMRPLLFAEPENPDLQNMSSSYLWGNDLLVSPVLQKGVTDIYAYFPAGSNWFDFNGSFNSYSSPDGKVAGGKTHPIPVSEGEIPVYVRGGAFIPMARFVPENTESYNQADIDIHFYLDTDVASSTGSLYLDDGKTADAYEKGQSEMITLQSAYAENTLNITIGDKPGKNYSVGKKRYLLYIHILDRKQLKRSPKTVIVGKEKVVHVYSNSSTFYVPVAVNPGETKIKIEFQ